MAPSTPDLGRFPRVPLAPLPTPLQPAPRLSELLGVEILFKRDDLTGLALGGNKVRKLEFLLGDALEHGCDTVVTFGAVQSNHARQTAAACASCGLRCELILTRSVIPAPDDTYESNGNALLDRLLGATCTIVDDDEEQVSAAIDALRERIAERGGRARWIPPGGSDAVGTLGYVAAGLELSAQLDDRFPGGPPAVIYVAVSSGGTVAGLLTGLRLAGNRAEVRGVDVFRTAEVTRPRVAGLVTGVADALGAEAATIDDVHLDDRWLGPGYGRPTPEMLEAITLVARTEGVLADPVYTGKALAALIGDCRGGRQAGGPIVFLHTGGAPALFADPGLFGADGAETLR
jgi:D-cysteine desulfhydrase family pyridoxal phosphate-dependent enzyme